MFKKFDKENMFESIWSFSENIKDALKIGDSIELKNKYDNKCYNCIGNN